jgi:hypothetical protein
MADQEVNIGQVLDSKLVKQDELDSVRDKQMQQEKETRYEYYFNLFTAELKKWFTNDSPSHEFKVETPKEFLKHFTRSNGEDIGRSYNSCGAEQIEMTDIAREATKRFNTATKFVEVTRVYGSCPEMTFPFGIVQGQIVPKEEEEDKEEKTHICTYRFKVTRTNPAYRVY